MHQRDERLRRLFSLTSADYDAIVAAQGGGCAICGLLPKRESANGRVWRLNVDHDHATGLVRGALCWRHNKALGAFRDNVEHLKAAILYLEDPPATRALGGPRHGRVGRVTNRRERRGARGSGGT